MRLYVSVLAVKGNDISERDPNFAGGAAGGLGGQAQPAFFGPVDFVSAPIGLVVPKYSALPDRSG